MAFRVSLETISNKFVHKHSKTTYTYTTQLSHRTKSFWLLAWLMSYTGNLKGTVIFKTKIENSLSTVKVRKI